MKTALLAGLAGLLILVSSGVNAQVQSDPMQNDSADNQSLQADPAQDDSAQAEPQQQSEPQQNNSAQSAPAQTQSAEKETGVARVSLIHGDVSTQRGDSGDWATAILNAPIVTGDRVSTGDDGRAEVQLDYAK